MGFTIPMMVAGLTAEHVHSDFRAAFGWARKDSGDDAFGGIAGAIPANSSDL